MSWAAFSATQISRKWIHKLLNPITVEHPKYLCSQCSLSLISYPLGPIMPLDLTDQGKFHVVSLPEGLPKCSKIRQPHTRLCAHTRAREPCSTIIDVSSDEGWADMCLFKCHI